MSVGKALVRPLLDSLDNAAVAFRQVRAVFAKQGKKNKDNNDDTQRMDHFDGGSGGGSGTSSSGGNPPPQYEHGVRFFGEEQLGYYTADNATLGLEGNAIFMMPAEDAVNVGSHFDAAIESGMAPSVTEAWRNGDSVYGAMIPVDHLPQRLPTAADAGGFEHFLPGGNTAVNVGGYHLPNATREFVVDGGVPLPPGTVVFELGSTGTWDILGIYG